MNEKIIENFLSLCAIPHKSHHEEKISRFLYDWAVKKGLAAVRDEEGNVIIANVAGATIDDYIASAEALDVTNVDMIELNISCPNVKAGGATWGVTCEGAASVTKAVRAATSKPLIVKLTPNVTNITEIAKAVEAEGADSISMINTLLGMRIDIRTKRPILHNNVGGLSGPAIFPVAVRMVWQCYNAVKIPIIGMGGISTWEDAVEMMMAGASAIQMGTAIFTDPWSPIKVIEGLNELLDRQDKAQVALDYALLYSLTYAIINLNHAGTKQEETPSEGQSETPSEGKSETPAVDEDAFDVLAMELTGIEEELDAKEEEKEEEHSENDRQFLIKQLTALFDRIQKMVGFR